MFSFNIATNLTMDPDKVTKQIRYGTAVGLTRTAKEGQAAVVTALRSKFTLRNRWFEQQTPVGIKITPATPSSLVSEIKTAAKFLPRQDSGGTKIPYGRFLAVPTRNVQPNKGALIPKSLRPANLKNAFVIITKEGLRLLCVRGVAGATKKGRWTLKRRVRGRVADLLVMYLLLPRVTIKQADIFDNPIRKVVDSRLRTNIAEGINTAMATAR